MRLLLRAALPISLLVVLVAADGARADESFQCPPRLGLGAGLPQTRPVPITPQVIAARTAAMFGRPTYLDDWPTKPLPAPDYLETLVQCHPFNYDTGFLTAPPPDAWLDSERRVYRDLLSGKTVDVLVAPVQVQGFGFDTVERALLTAELAYSLGEQGLTIADPVIVDRALGEGNRRISHNDIFALGESLHARMTIESYAGHDRDHHLTLTLRVTSHSSSGSWTTVQKDFVGLPFSDEDPPHSVVHRMRKEIIAAIGIGASPHRVSVRAAGANKGSSQNAQIAEGPHELATRNTLRLSPSLVLATLGSLTQTLGERTRERLFVRALIQSEWFESGNADAQFARAISLAYLERRPAARAAAQKLATPAGITLTALLDGNLPESRASLAAVHDPLQNYLLTIMTNDLAANYNSDAIDEAPAAARAFGKASNQWSALVQSRGLSQDAWAALPAMVLKSATDELFPVAGLDTRSLYGGQQVVNGAAPDDVAIDIAIGRQLHRTAAALPVAPCCNAGSAAPGERDLLTLLENNAEVRVAKSIGRVAKLQGLDDQGLQMLGRYDSFYAGHPGIELLRFQIEGDLARTAPDDLRASHTSQGQQVAQLVAYYTHGATYRSAEALVSMGIPAPPSAYLADAYGYDWPRRGCWFPWLLGQRGVEAQSARNALETLNYGVADLDLVLSAARAVPAAERTEFIKSVSSRFNGAPGRAQRLATLHTGQRMTTEQTIASLRSDLNANPGEWGSILQLGKILIGQEGNYSDAATLFLSYPGFRDKDPRDPVALSNAAGDAATLLFLQGRADLSRQLLTIAANSNTGSNAEMTSQMRLEQLDGNFVDATGLAILRASRYATAANYRDSLSYLHAFDRSEDAWKGFSQVATQFELPQVWVSALVGQRRQRLTEDALRSWLKQPETASARFGERLFAPWYALLWSATDRAPSDATLDLIAELDAASAATVDYGGMLMKPLHSGQGSTPIYPSALRDPKSLLQQGASVPSELVLFSRAYAAVRRGNYTDARGQFVKMIQAYPIEGDRFDPPSTAYPYAYFVYAAAKTGDTQRLADFTKQMIGAAAPIAPSFDGWLAQAFLDAARKDNDAAVKSLEHAFNARPGSDFRPILTAYQYAEACEWLFRDTGDTRFRDALLDWVARYQQTQPMHAWAYALEYAYSPVSETRVRALAMTRYLDPLSPRIAKAARSEVAKADAWLAGNNPFDLKRLTAQGRKDGV